MPHQRTGEPRTGVKHGAPRGSVGTRKKSTVQQAIRVLPEKVARDGEGANRALSVANAQVLAFQAALLSDQYSGSRLESLARFAIPQSLRKAARAESLAELVRYAVKLGVTPP